ncbi:MAG: type IV pilus assembly protein PilM [Candidatus Cloacimonadales bacterium]|jgi:type IV pilus assembly protein PilM|nr:type IV pilus assembly protein PilM [Candidatus Cloacimonadales bacterium]HQB40572.1 type IV pilus assembly protein PilM [Candidatus Cloacimonadota bacterium]
MAKKKVPKFKESIGIDIGTHSVKIVHLKRIHEGFKLLNYEVRQTVPQGLEYIPSELRPDRFAPVIAEMLRSMKINTKKIQHLVTCIGGDNISIKQIKTIFLPDEELESALFFEAKKHLPISGGEMILDYQVLSVEEKTNNMNVLLVATTKDEMKSHINTLVTCGLNPSIVDAQSLAVANVFALNTYVEDGVYVILNIGAHRTNMVVYGPQAKFFARDIDLGGFNFTKDIMRSKDMTFEEAENYKFEFGLQGPQAQVQTLSLSTLDISEKPTEETLALEVKRSLRFYVKEAGSSDFKKVLLIGGGAKLAGLQEYLAENLNLETEIYDPFYNLEMPEKFREKKDPQLALALGLAMRKE